MGAPLEIVVTVKQVPDPEGPSSSFVVDEEKMRVTPEGIPPVINPYDENALEAAIRLKETHGARITLLSVGNRLAPAVFLKALATGADALLCIDDPALDRERLDARATANLLAAAVLRSGMPDLILSGRQASDTNAGQTALGLAALLGIPAVSMARKVELRDGRLRVERVLPDGYEVVTAPVPALVTVSHEAGDLRYPALAAIKAAKSLPRTTWSLSEQGIEQVAPAARLVSLKKPDRSRRCRLAAGETGPEAGEALARLLIEDRVV